MIDEERALMEVRRVVSNLPMEDRTQVESIAKMFRNILKADARGYMALALVTAEAASR